MNLIEILSANGDRHLTASEREQLRSCASGLENGIRVSAAVEECEAAVVEDVVATLRDRYPRFGQLQSQAWERLAADLQLILRHDVRALLIGDPRALDDSVLLYLRSIFSAYRLSHAFLRECFTLLRHQLAARLEPDDLSALAPYLERNIEVLASGAEPNPSLV